MENNNRLVRSLSLKSHVQLFSRAGVLLLFPALLFSGAVRADEPAGAAIYQQKCARCHGKSGQGSKDYPHPLIGKRLLPQLAKYIAKSMPEDDPGTCTGADAEKVAAYIFDAFYSPAAQARNKAPRIELARLTVNEYRNAVADLVGTFRSARRANPPRTSMACAASTSAPAAARRARALAFARVDPVVRFDFGPPNPDLKSSRPSKSPQTGKAPSSPSKRASTTSSCAPSIRRGCGSTT